MDFCTTINLVSRTWYHYAFSLTSQNGGSLNCYLNGETINVGSTPVSQIATNIFSFTEISFGTSTTLKPAESPFTGYIREFRWWKNPRN
jgi:Concanavalin A-like lectin/glucanases superfamily